MRLKENTTAHIEQVLYLKNIYNIISGIAQVFKEQIIYADDSSMTVERKNIAGNSAVHSLPISNLDMVLVAN